MSFSRIPTLITEFSKSNSTLDSLPSTLLDATIPGYGLISQIIFRAFGVDIGLLGFGCLILFALIQGGHYFYKRTYEYFEKYFTSSIEIDNDDDIYEQILKWIAQQRMTKVSRDLRAVTEQDNSEDGDDTDNEDVLDDQGMFNYDKWVSNIAPRYEPNFGGDKFMWNGRRYYFLRSKLDAKRSGYGYRIDQTLTIRCTGRSTQPVKDLISHIKSWTRAKETKMTSIYRPIPKEDYDGNGWDRHAFRPSRHIDTVALDKEQKQRIVQDVNDYLHPATARWYSARGIPYRRGYLFHGPPGTGKSSLSFALAGIFGLNVYVVSLSEAGLTESDLSKLFSKLPKRSIVLLEGIDSAGLSRDNGESSSKSTDTTTSSENDGDSEDELTKITKTSKKDPVKGPPKPSTKSLITLSGLLNIIDGAASHEGRVLIMSTNYPEKLDSALIRPGRVDLQVEFTLATHDQMKDIFVRMYSTDLEQDQHDTLQAQESTSTSPLENSYLKQPKLTTPDPEKIEELAVKFADLLPEGCFSPAEIQGYLLMKKTDPEGALRDAARWRDTLLEAKRKGRKVVSV